MIHTGTTSMHLAVDVYSRHPHRLRAPQDHPLHHHLRGHGRAGQPDPGPQWQPVSEGDLQLQQYAREADGLRGEMNGVR